MNLGEPLCRVKCAGSMKNENDLGPAKNTTVSPRIRVRHTWPCWRVRESVKVNGSFRNWRASPTNGAPMDPGGGWLITSHRTPEEVGQIGRIGAQARLVVCLETLFFLS